MKDNFKINNLSEKYQIAEKDLPILCAILDNKKSLFSQKIKALLPFINQINKNKFLYAYCQELLKREFQSLSVIDNDKIKENIVKFLLESKEILNAIYPPIIINKQINNIGFVGVENISQCRNYRIYQKIDHLKELKINSTIINLDQINNNEYKKILFSIDALIIHRTQLSIELLHFIYYAKSLGIIIYYDIDDLIFEESLFSQYEDYKNSISLDAYLNMRYKYSSLIYGAMYLCDNIMVSTESLSKYVKKYFINKNIIIYPNLLNQILLYIKNTRKNNDKIKIFYGSNTLAHKKEFYDLLKIIYKILEKYPNVEFHYIGKFNIDPPTNVKHQIFSNIKTLQYHEFLSYLSKCDINLSIFEKNPHTDCKSVIKWIESGYFNIPSIVSDSSTYREELTNGKNVIIAKNQEEWIKALSLMIENSSVRLQIGKNANKQIKEKYLSNHGVNKMKDIFQNIKIKNKKKLLITNVYFYPNSIGGATRVVENEVKYLIEKYKEEYDIYILTTGRRSKTLEINQFYHNDCLITQICYKSKPWSHYIDKDIFNFCDEFYSHYKFDLIHFHCIQEITGSSVEAAIKNKIPYIITLHDYWWISNDLFFNYEDKNITQNIIKERSDFLLNLLKGAEKVLAVSKNCYDIYKSKVELTNLDINENGINTFSINKNTPKDKIVIGHIGGSSKHKGRSLISESIRLSTFKNIEFIFFEDRRNIEIELINGNKIKRTPLVPYEEIEKIYNSVDVIIVPSKWPETYSLVSKEALYSNTWLIASNLGASKNDIIENVNGNIIDVSDHSDLLKILRDINENPNKVKSLKTKYDARTQKDQCKELYIKYIKPIIYG